MSYQIIAANCTHYLQTLKPERPFDLIFMDPPFNQDKDYALHEDSLPDAEYWDWMQQICQLLHRHSQSGAALYFMQREKNAEPLLRIIREAGWTFQNLIIWKKLTSAVPSNYKYGKHYQIIVYATKGKRARVFHKLRIDPPLPANYKYEREKGMFVTDVWDDIRELTSGYFAGDEALRDEKGERWHKQQAPLALLLRILLSSSQVGAMVCDPFAGTGTTLIVAEQLGRHSLGIEIDPANVTAIEKRLQTIRPADQIQRFYRDYHHTPNLAQIWGVPLLTETTEANNVLDLPLFRSLDQT